MKKIISKVLAFFGGLFMVFALVGCGVSQGTADKINDAAKEKDYMTWTEVVDILGTDYVGLSGGNAENVTGWVYWYKGYETMEEVNEALEAGKTVKYIRVDFFLGEAKNAEYGELTPEEE